MRSARFGLLLAILALTALAQFAVPGSAQDLATGFQVYGAYHVSDFDSVNMQSHNLDIHIPLYSYPQRGDLPDYSMFIKHSPFTWVKTLWNVNPNVYKWTPTNASRTPLYAAIDHFAYGRAFRDRTVIPNTVAYRVNDGSGASHIAGWVSSSSQLETVDGSGYRINLTSSSVTDRNGVTYFTSGGRVMADSKGNTITQDNSRGIVIDSVGRQIPNGPAGGSSPGCSTVNLPSVNGGGAPLTFCYANYTATSNYQEPNVLNGSYTYVFLQSVILANGTSWSFTYNSWGDLESITAPTGAVTSYTWTTYDLRTCGGASSRVVATRTVDAKDGTGPKTWTYTGGLMTDPLGNDTLYGFTPATPTSYCGPYLATKVQHYNGSHLNAANLVKTDETQYVVSGPNPFSYIDNTDQSIPYSMLPSVNKTTWPSGAASETCLIYDGMNKPPCSAAYTNSGPNGTFYDKNSTSGTTYPFVYGNVAFKWESDYGPPGLVGPALRETISIPQWQNSNAYLTANLLSPLTSVTIVDGNSVQLARTDYAYDESNGSVCTTLPCGNATSVTRWLNTGTSPKTQYVYNSNGMRTTMCDPIDTACANPTRYTYDSTGMFLSRVQYPNTGSTAHIENFSYDFNTGLLNWHEDQNGQRTSFGYDTMRRMKRVDFPDFGWETFCYVDKPADSCPSTNTVPSLVFTKAINSGTSFVQVGLVDGLGRPKQSKTTVPTSTCFSGYSYVDTTYDGDGRKFSVSNPYCINTEATYGLTQTHYDVLGRVTSVVEQDNSTVSTDYSASAFPCTTVTDEAGKKRKSCSSGLGTTVYEDPNGLNYQTGYNNDPLGNMTAVYQSGSRIRTFTYDSLSRLVCAANPEMQIATCPNPDSGTYTAGTIRYGYDANGNMTSETSPKPNQSSGSTTVTTTYLYDALNRLTQKSYDDGSTPTVQYGYDAIAPANCSPSLTMNYPIGQRTAMCDAAGNEAWSYDKMGRVAQDRRTTNSITKSTAYAYNFDGSIAQLTYPSGRTITYTPNVAAQTVSAVDTVNGINYATMAMYSPQGALRSLTNSAGILSTLYYDKRLEPCRIAVNSGGTAPSTCGDGINNGNVLDYSYNFNLGAGDNGNVSAITNNLTKNSPSTDRSQWFTYDALNRLLTAGTASTSGTNCWGEQYGYDAWGNLLSITGITPQYYTCTQESGFNFTGYINGNNHITSSGFLYDTGGNLLNIPGSNYYGYDGEGRLNLINNFYKFQYDGDGKRVGKSARHTTCFYFGCITTWPYYQIYWYDAGGRVLEEDDGNGNLTDEYVFFGGKRIARRNVSSGNIYYYFTDHLGTARVVTNASGTIQDDSDFYPFGVERPILSSSGNRYKFTGKERDSDLSGLDNFGARFDASQYGRFMSPDGPLIYQDRNDPQSLNLYSYVRNNPANGVDPDGHLTIIIPGTWAQPSDWNMDMKMVQEAREQFNDDDVRILTWHEGLGGSDIAQGAAALNGMVNAHDFAPGEKLNIIAHSRGGDVALDATNILSHKIDNLVTLATPNYGGLIPISQSMIGFWLSVTTQQDRIPGLISIQPPTQFNQAHQISLNAPNYGPFSAHKAIWADAILRSQWWQAIPCVESWNPKTNTLRACP